MSYEDVLDLKSLLSWFGIANPEQFVLSKHVSTKSNLAIKNHEVENVLSFLTEDINKAASNGEIHSGKIAFKNALTTIFSNNPDLYFVRNSEEVLLNAEKNIAWEKALG